MVQRVLVMADMLDEIIEAIPQAASIEILPRFMIQHQTKLQSSVLGVSMQDLFKLYISLVKSQSEHWSLVALLATTENLSAVNTRKRMINSGGSTPEYELHLLDVILSSRLVKHCKSSLLWEYRRFVLRFAPSLLDLDRELKVIGKAAVNHPTNYYAWWHARCLLRSCMGDDRYIPCSPTENPNPEPITTKISQWAWQLCRENVSDVSVWSFLACLENARDYVPGARGIHDRWPHDAIATFLSIVETTPTT